MRTLEQIKKGQIDADTKLIGGGGVDLAFDMYKNAMQQSGRSRTPVVAGGTANPIMTYEKGVQGNQNLIKKPSETYADALARNRARAAELSAGLSGAKATVQEVKDILFGGRNYTHVNPTFSLGKEYDTMTPEEAGAFVSLTKQGKAQEAKEYMEALQMELNQRNAQIATQRARETAEKNAVAGVGLDVAGAMSSGAGALYSLWQEARGKAIDPYHSAYGGVALREGASEGLIGDSTGIEKFLKEAGLATAEWAGQALTMGGLAPFSMAAGAAGATSRDAAMRGATSEEAAMLGVVGGAAEAVAEKIGFDRWLRFGDMAALKGNKGQLVAQILKDMGSEGLEEGATEIANILADTVIMGDKSQMADIYNAAKANGMTEAQAIGEALKTAAGQIGYSAGLGAMSGGMIGGGMAAAGRMTGQNPLETARRTPEVAADTNVGTTQTQTAPQGVSQAQTVNPSADTETQPTERQSRARKIVEDKLFYENGQKAFEEEYQRTGKTDHFDAFHTYYSAGVRGLKEADIRQNVFTENADKVMLNKAYIAGAMDRAADLEARKANAGKVAQTVGVFGAVDKLTEGKRNYLDAISKVMGIEIEVEETAPYNGKYENGRMYVAADAESFVGTVSHEMGHIIRQVAPESYADIEQMVFARLEKMDGKSYAERLAEYDAKLNRTEGVGRGGYSEAALAEEMICDGLQAIVQSEADAAEFFRSMEQKSPGILQKLKAFLEEMLQKLRELIGNEAYKEIAADLRQDEAFVKDLRDRVAKAAVEVGKAEPRKQNAKQAAKTEGAVIEKVGAQIDAETQSAAPKMSLRTWSESDYAKDKKTAAKVLAESIGVTQEEAEKWIDDINSVAKIIADDRVRLDYESNLDETATVLKSNQEYKWTLDMSTLCAKRLLYTGTMDAIQRAMPDTAFTSEDLVKIRQMMMERGHEVACGICYVESTRREMGPITEEFINRYKEAQETGKPMTRVNFQGKESELTSKGRVFYAEKGYTPTLADLNTTDIDLVKRDHPDVYAAYLAFMNARGQAKPKLLETRAEYKGEIAKTFRSKTAVKSRNDAGGLRVQSFSDFEVPHMIDMMQAVMDMAKVGLKAQAYTKVPEFAAVFGGTGMKINLSLIAKGDGVDSKGNLIFDDVEGIDHKKAFKLREQYSKNVGTILVGKNKKHIIAAMADPKIDFIIPFHKSSWKESLYDALGLTGYGDYTATQNEKPIDKSRKIKNFDPSEYWRFDLSGDENAQIYLDKCRKDGRIPKFPEFSSYPGYWKLLIDFKMYDNDGNGSPQMEVQPEFNMKEARKILKAYEGGHRSFPVAEDVVDVFVAEKQGKNVFADETTGENVKFSVREKDAEYMKAVETGDMETAQRMINEAAYEKGYRTLSKIESEPQKVFHGTDAKFTVFSKAARAVHGRYFGKGFYFTDSEKVAEYFSGKNVTYYNPESGEFDLKKESYIMGVFLDVGNVVYINAQQFGDFSKLKRAANDIFEDDEVDGMVILNIKDGTDELTNVYVVKSESQIKSADSVTYDNDGNIIPLSERFNPENKDIRWSVRESGEAELLRENRSLRSENEHLQKLNENLKRQFKLTDGKTPDPKAVHKVAKTWLKQIQSKSDLDDFSMKLGKVAEYFAKAKTDHENDQAMAALRVLVRDAMEEAETLNTEMRDNYSDLISYIKRTTLKVSDDLKEELEHYGGYNNFRRERFGSMKLSSENGRSIDSFYYDLCMDYPEFFKEGDATDEAEQLMNIAAVLDTLKPVAENPYGYYIDEYVEDEAAGLLNMITDIEMEQTFADKKKAEKIAALKKLKAEFNTTIRQMRKEAKEAQEAAVKKAVYDTQTVERMYHYRLTADYLAKLDRLKLKQKKMRDTRKRREYRQSLEKRAKDLLKRLKGDDKRPIPEEMRAGVEALLTGFSTDRNDTITILQKDLVRVQKAYEAAGKTDGDLDFDDDTKVLLDEFAQVFVTKYGARVHLDDLLTEEMKMLRDIVRNLQHIISNANKLKALEKSVEVAAVGDAFLAENGNRKIVAQAGVLRQIGDFFNLDMLDSISFFKRMGDAAYNYIFKGFRNGLDRKIAHVKEAVDFMNGLVDEKTVKHWRGEKPQKYELTHGEIWLDIPQKMSLYCLMRREQAKLHMYAGGIKADLDRAALRKGKAAAEALKQYTGIMVTEADLNVIVDTLTAEQKRVAEAMQDFLSDNVADWGNETSMLMFGYKKFTEKNYFPIVSDKDYINTIAGKDENVTQSLRSLGFTKKTLDTANNPIMIQDIFSVFAKHVDQMSSYNAFVPATSDTNKFLNYKGKITDTGKEDNVKTVLRRIMGDKAVGYIHKLVDTINGAVSYSDEGYLPKMLVRNMKISSVGANARVIVQQPVSILRAGAVIDMKYLLGAMAPSRSDFDMIVKYAPIAQWKMWGNYDVNVGRSIEELTGGQNYYQKMTEWMMAGASVADKFTWGRIWKACELEVKHNHPDWVGDRFYEAVGERFSQIIDETQVVDSPLHRSQMMRSKGLYTQMVTSFMSEPTKTYNMATNALMRLRQNPTPENRKAFARTVWYLALNAVAVAAAAGLVDAARDDDDEEWADKWLQAFRGDYSDEDMSAKDKVITFLGSNVGSGVNPMNYIPYLRDVWSLIEGYDIKRTDFDWLTDIMNWMTRVHKFSTGESEYTLASMLANTAGAFSKLFGIPAKSALRDLNAVKNWTVSHLIGDEEMKYENRKITYDIGSEKNTGDYVERMLEAEFTGNKKLAAKIYNDMVKAGIDNETINSKIKSSQKKLMQEEPEIAEAVEAYSTGDIRNYQKAINSLTGKGYAEGEVLSAVRSAYNKTTGEEQEEELTFDTIRELSDIDNGEKAAESYDYRMLFNAFMDGAQSDYSTLWQMLEDGGKKDSNIRSSMRTRLKDAYWDAKDSGDYNRAEKARKEFLRLGGKAETLTYR
ncbi:ADP-ribosyltransferase-containing protein [Anaerotignum sp.]